MLGPSRFLELTSLALVLLFEHYPVWLEPLNGLQMLSWIDIFAHIAWVYEARHEVTGVACDHEKSARDLVPTRNVLVRHTREAILDVHVEATESADKVDNLHQWVRLIANVSGTAIDTFHAPLPTNLCSDRPQRVGKILE